MSNPQPILELSNIHTYYGNIHALKGVSCAILPGEIACLIGANGAGKSTTLMTIFGVERAAQGKILFKGEPIHHLRPEQVAARGVSQAPEGRQIFPKMSCRENLEMGAYLRDDDVYWFNADPGWVTGTSYGIIGPWVWGVTQCVLDSGFKASRWYEFIQEHKVTVWYSAPTAIRSLMREPEETVKSHDLSSLRHLASVDALRPAPLGRPIRDEPGEWQRRVRQARVAGVVLHQQDVDGFAGLGAIHGVPPR